MLVHKAFRYQLYPSAEQAILFRKTAGCRRLVWNLALDCWIINSHRMNPKWLTFENMCNELTELKEVIPFLKEVPHHTLVPTLRDFFKTISKWYKGECGFSKYKRRGERDSFRFPDPKQVKFAPEKAFVPKAGWVDWVQHRPLEGKPKSATVSLDGGDWYISVLCEIEIAEPVHEHPESVVGLDIGVAKPITTSDGEFVMLPRTSDEERRKLANLQRSVARKKKGSSNKRKAQRKVTRFQAKLRRRRKDAADKATTTLAKNHGIIVIEDLRIKNMTASAKGTVDSPGKNVGQKAGLNRSILDIAPYQIRSMLEYKARWYGSQVIAVAPQYTSQTCSKCGYCHAENRVSQAVFFCRRCGHSENADVNAAKNIQAKGLAQLQGTAGLAGLVCDMRTAQAVGSRKRTGVSQGSSVL